MGIKEEIFEEFLGVLQKEKEIPSSIVAELKRLKESGESISEEKVLELVEKGCKDVNGDKEN